MKKHFALILLLLVVTGFLTACGWKPEVSAVPLTAPWDAMNLPVKSNAVVWKSEPNEFRAVHKDDKRKVMKDYTDALKAQGWEPADFKEDGDRFYVDMKRSGEVLKLEFYDFDNTGVVIKKEGGTATTNETAPPAKSPEPSDADGPTGGSPTAEKADFTVTSEQYDKEFTTKGAKEADLQKYANKNIAVTGRVSLLSLEKKGTVQPWVTLFAPGTLNGVSCYFDDENVDQMKRLKMDKMVNGSRLAGRFYRAGSFAESETLCRYQSGLKTFMNMKKKIILTLTVLCISAFFVLNASAQFPIKIPKIKIPKTEQPKTDANPTVSNDAKQNENRSSVRLSD